MFLSDWLFKWVRLHFWQIFSSSVSALQKALVCLTPACLALHILLVISSSTNDFQFFFWLQSLKSCEKELAGKKLSLFSSQILVRAKTKVCAREFEISRNKWGGLGRLRGKRMQRLRQYINMKLHNIKIVNHIRKEYSNWENGLGRHYSFMSWHYFCVLHFCLYLPVFYISMFASILQNVSVFSSWVSEPVT